MPHPHSVKLQDTHLHRSLGKNISSATSPAQGSCHLVLGLPVRHCFVTHAVHIAQARQGRCDPPSYMPTMLAKSITEDRALGS